MGITIVFYSCESFVISRTYIAGRWLCDWKISTCESRCSPYGTMRGGMINCAVFILISEWSRPLHMSKAYPNTKVTESGVYKVFHADDHVPAHYVTVLHGETFPV
jgi:hypothetical protein